MNYKDKNKWDEKYLSFDVGFSSPSKVLAENEHLLPDTGLALDLACGNAANAVFLAKKGLDVSAWDISSVIINKLDVYNKDNKLPIKTKIKDVVSSPPLPNKFDIIIVSNFLDRLIIDDIKNAIKSHGLIFYQTFIKEKLSLNSPKNSKYLLDKNELLFFFKGWNILLYREEGRVGQTDKGFRNQAMLIAQKP